MTDDTTTQEVIAEMMRDEQTGGEFTQEYLKRNFLSSIRDSLFYAQKEAGLSNEEIAKRLNVPVDTVKHFTYFDGKDTSFEQYLKFALACGVMPRPMKLEKIEVLRDEAIANRGVWS